MSGNGITPLTLPVTPVFPAIVHTGDIVRTTTYGNVVRQALIDLWTDVQAIDASGGKVQSVFGRAGVVVAQAGDYTAAQITGAVAGTRQVIAGTGMTGGGALTADVTLNANVISVFGRTGAVVLTQADMSAAGLPPDSSTQRVRVDAAGALAGTRPELNFIQGANVALTIADNPGANRVDVTIAATGSGGAAQTPWVSDINAAGFKLNSVGSLGIGGPAQPNMALSVAGGYIEAAISAGYSGNLYTDGTNWRYRAAGSGFIWNVGSGSTVFYTAPTGTAGAIATITPRITFPDAGTSVFSGAVTVTTLNAAATVLTGSGTGTFNITATIGNNNAAAAVTAGIVRITSANDAANNALLVGITGSGKQAFAFNSDTSALFGGPLTLSGGVSGEGGELHVNDFDNGGSWILDNDTARNCRFFRSGSANIIMQLNNGTGNVGIGGGAAYRRLSVAGAGLDYTQGASGAGLLGVGTGVTQTDIAVLIGATEAGFPHGWIQTCKSGTAYYPLMLNAVGGGLVLNAPAAAINDSYLPANTFTVYVSGSSLIFRVRNSGGTIVQGSVAIGP